MSDVQVCLDWLMNRRQGRSKVLTEIEKCDLVCANCHRIRTYERAAGVDVKTA